MGEGWVGVRAIGLGMKLGGGAASIALLYKPCKHPHPDLPPSRGKEDFQNVALREEAGG
jgi:hypothetical protein